MNDEYVELTQLEQPPSNLFERLSRTIYMKVERNNKWCDVPIEDMTPTEITDMWGSDEEVVSLAKMIYLVDKLQAYGEFLKSEGYVKV